MLAPSTLHLFWDLLGQLATERVTVLVEEGTYAIARWGAERAAGRGVPVRSFTHHDPGALAACLRRVGPGHRPIVLCDGICPDCGRVAPLQEYLRMAETHGGLTVVDDSQALGLLGSRSAPTQPYGAGGGGSARWLGIGGPGLVLISSLAKGLGVPVAVLAGSTPTVRRFELRSETRVHCSPPSAADLHAAGHALAINRKQGDALRRRLADNVALFRGRMRETGMPARGGGLPMQTLEILASHARGVHEQLARGGIRAVLRQDRHSGGPLVSLIVTAAHEPEAIEQVVQTLLAILPRGIRTG